MLVALLLLSSGFGHTPETRVDVIEVNHYHDDLGRLAYTQAIYYQWSSDYQRMHVVAWMLIDKGDHVWPKKLPDGYWHFRGVKAKSFRETWTATDPERDNKRFLAERNRSGLKLIR